MSWDKLVNLWKNNIRKNLTKISASLGQMIITILATVMFITKEGYDWRSAIIILSLVLVPFFNWWINIIFKGEAELKDHEIALLQRELDHEREVSEFKIQVASVKNSIENGVKANYDWNELNRKIDEINAKIGI